MQIFVTKSANQFIISDYIYDAHCSLSNSICFFMKQTLISRGIFARNTLQTMGNVLWWLNENRMLFPYSASFLFVQQRIVDFFLLDLCLWCRIWWILSVFYWFPTHGYILSFCSLICCEKWWNAPWHTWLTSVHDHGTWCI